MSFSNPEILRNTDSSKRSDSSYSLFDDKNKETNYLIGILFTIISHPLRFILSLINIFSNIFVYLKIK